MRTGIVGFLLLVSLVLADEQIVFRCDFDKPESIPAGPGRMVTDFQSTPSLEISLSEPGTATRSFSIPTELLKDPYVTLRAVVRADAISAPPNSWNGIKVMLVLKTEGGTEYPQIPFPTGSFDWKPFVHTFRRPANLKSATLIVGLEFVKGTVAFDNLQVASGRPPRKGLRYNAPFSGHSLDRLRGVMYGPACRPDDLRNLARNWKANQVRWQLNWEPMNQAEQWAIDLRAYDDWLQGVLKQCDDGIRVCAEEGLLVLVDLHCPPGGRSNGGVCRLFQDKKYQDYFLDLWPKIALRYKDAPNVYAFDLLNEAVEGAVAPGLMNWRDLAAEATRRIRAVDPDRAVVFEPSPWGAASGFDTLEPLPLQKVIYSFHMYEPSAFTHQTLYNNPGGVVYPGTINGQTWNRAHIAEAFRSVREFQTEFNVRIYVGEFSAIRWAPADSARDWLRDVIDQMEEYGWDWSYHAYREWDGWSVEHGPDRNNHTPAAEPTPRMKLLLDHFSRNQKPASWNNRQ
ncbi:MAG: glycoside hydrolase family 5 protein [Phycisphaerae bacterium]|nr:glycoside hydrolase family 5 protein [Phycisphaerae bacterium]